MISRFATRVFVLAMAASAFGCRAKETVSNAPGSASAPTPDPKVLPDAAVRQALNPAEAKPYSGPVGHVSGTVHATGDAPPPDPLTLAKIPPGKCEDARAFYGKLFREGPHRELGDVLVTVTGYEGYLPVGDP